MVAAFTCLFMDLKCETLWGVHAIYKKPKYKCVQYPLIAHKAANNNTKYCPTVYKG